MILKGERSVKQALKHTFFPSIQPGKLFCLCVLALLLLSSCRQEPASVTTTETETFVIAQKGDILQLVPFRSTDGNSSTVINLIHEGLMAYGPDYSLEKRLAEAYSYSEDGLTLTFTLKEGIHFHDGSPFTSADVKYSFDAARSKEMKSTMSLQYDFIDSIDTPDDHTVIFHLKYTYGPGLDRMTLPIVSQSFIEANDFEAKDFSGYNNVAVGTGAFKMIAWQPDISVSLEANEAYWQGAPAIKRVEVRPIPDSSVRLSAFEKGEVDYMTEIVPDEVDRIAAQTDKFTMLSYPQLSFFYMTWNTRLPLFQDLALRQALTHATNKDEIISSILAGHAVKSITPYAYTHKYYNANIDEPYPYDKEKAIEILENAGYRKGEDGIYISPQGLRCSFTTQVSDASSQIIDIAQLLKQWFLEVGVEMNISKMAIGAIYDNMDAVIAGNKPEDAYESMMGSMGTGIDPDMTRYLHSDGGLNDYRYANPEVDQLLEEGARLIRFEERKPIYDRIQEILAQDLPCLMIYFPEANNAVSAKFEGMSASPYGQIYALKDVRPKH